MQLLSHPPIAFPASSFSRAGSRISTLRSSALAALLLVVGTGCGTDSGHPYAGLSRTRVELDEAGYVLRYLAPPWERVDDDPLAKGTRKSAAIGGENRAILADSGRVLEIARVSNSDMVAELTFPKYRLEAALVPCTQEEVGDLSCAAYLADLDYAARQADDKADLFESKPRAHRNDWSQTYYELIGQSATTGRFRRVIFFESASLERVAAWILIEANPDLGEREITQLVHAFEMLPGTGGQP